MTNETNIPEAVYISPVVLCRITLTQEEIKIESVTIEREGVHALFVFRNEEDAESYRREFGIYPEEDGFKVLPAEDEVVRDLLAMHHCTHVVTPNSWLGEESSDLYTAEDFMRILESAVPA
jgi:hypothetical protein